MKKLTTTKRLERLTERYMNGGMDRRTFLGLAAAVIGAGVHQVDTAIYGQMEGPDGFGLLEAAVKAAHGASPKAQNGNLQTGGA